MSKVLRIKLETINAIIRTARCATKEEFRGHLQFVWLTPTINGMVLIEATDGHKLTRTTIFDQGLYDLIKSSDRPYLGVHYKDAKLIKASLGKKSEWQNEYAVELNGDYALTINGVECMAMYGEKPNIDAVMPNSDDYESIVSFNVDYLVDLLKACDKKRTNSVVIKMQKGKNGDLSPLLIGIDSNVTSVLMPCRLPMEDN